MRAVAGLIGFAWVAVAVIAMFYQGWRQLRGASGIIFEGGTGDVYLFALAAAPGYLLFRWGSKGKESA